MILQKKGHRQFQCVSVSNQMGRWQKSNQSVTLSLPRRDRSMLSLRVQDSWIARVPTMHGHRHDHYNVLADNIIMCTWQVGNAPSHFQDLKHAPIFWKHVRQIWRGFSGQVPGKQCRLPDRSNCQWGRLHQCATCPHLHQWARWPANWLALVQVCLP